MDTSKLTTQNVITAVKSFISEQKYDGFAINCKTKDEAELFLTALHFLGRYWSEDTPIINDEGKVTVRYKYKDATCYRFYLDDPLVMKGSKTFYERKGIEIYSFEDLIATYLRFDDYINDEPETEKSEDLKKSEETKEIEKTEDETSETSGISGTSGTSEINEIEEPEPLNDETEIESNEPNEPNESKTKAVETVRMAEKGENTPKNRVLVNLCNLLGVGVNEPFMIECGRILLFLPNTLYRINEYGVREYLADTRNDWWAACNDEKELSYLISHPEIIVRLKR